MPCGQPPPPRLTKASQPDCISEPGEPLSYASWVRAREPCGGDANLDPQIVQKTIKNQSKIYQKSIKNRSWGLLGASWGPLKVKMAPRAKMMPKKGPVSPLPQGHVGAQNRSKSVPRAIQKVIIFLIIFWIDFWSDFVPTWPQLGSQNPPKMGPSWLQNRCKLGYRFSNYF